MDERRVADYFVVAGLPEQAELVDDFTRDGVHLKPSHNQAPITDVTVIFRGLGEEPPPGFTVIESTPTGFLADLNHGSLRSPDVYICYRRGREKPPLVDIGVMYEGKERIMADAECVLTTPGGRVANINNSAAKIFVTYRRASPSMSCNELVVTDICVILTNKGETPPHAFCMINKNLNKGMVGSDVFLCYKKSMNRATLISYKPGILARYPLYDLADFPFPPPVPLFCLPMGATIESWPSCATQPRPVFSTFVLTVRDASEKLYGSAVTFYERLSKEQLNAEQCRQLELTEDKTVNVNKCICLLSHWPFFDTFEKFLLFLYETTSSGPLPVPIERYISHFLECVPFPSAQRPQILVQLSSTAHIVLTQPEDLPLPRSGASFRELLMNLGADNCLLVLLLALTEQKLLVHSLRPDVLTAVAEAISMIIFPFKWQCPYIPLCPLGLAEVLHAPLPFLIGVDSRFFDLYDPPTDVNCVDLDTNTITVCEEKRGLTMKLLPKKAARALRTTLDQLSGKLQALVYSLLQESGKESSVDRDFQLKRKEQALELEIQEAFLRFMATILKGYKAYLQPITKAPTIGTTDPSSLFDLHGFLRSRDKAHNKFFSLVMKTQMFIRFIEERSFVSNMDADLVFFDECTEKVDGDEADSRLLETDESHQSERTVFIAPPEPAGLPLGITYSYLTFSLNPVLFSRKELKHFVTSDGAKLSSVLQSSPLARRTKHEIKSAQKLARKYAASPDLWAKCLLSTCYSLWFLHLPSYALVSRSKAPACLRTAYELLVKTNKMKLQPADEVCYRVIMQLCGVYSQPVLAVKLLFHMKRCGIQPNAITYGFYNRAVLDSTWPSDFTNSGQLLWNKLRNVVIGVALFRRAAAKKRALDASYTDSADVISRTSVDSSNSHEHQEQSESRIQVEGRRLLGSHGNLTDEPDFAAFDRYRNRHGSIVRPTGTSLVPAAPAMHQQSFESSAGLLMTHQYDSPVLWEETDSFDAGSPVDSSAVGGRKTRNRSGSCSEFVFGLRGPHCPTSPKTGRSPDASTGDNWRQLMRSESFANDARILDNLNRLKAGLSKESVLANGRVAALPDMKEHAHGAHRKGSISRALFGRKNSLSMRHSRESSTENLEERSSAGSTDDLDSVDSHSSRHSRLFSVMQRWGAGKSGGMTRPNTTTTSCERNCSPERGATSPSQKTSPVRTPVTENDPLGALELDTLEVNGEQPDTDSVFMSGLDMTMPEASERPLLFGRGVSRSATFGADQESCVEGSKSAMQRSSTMPVDSPAGGFKLPFSSRFSPARLSLRARELRASTQIIENAFANFSPGSLTSKKSNELLQGGLNSLKSAATSVAKKFDEIKEAMSATSTPVKANTAHCKSSDRESLYSEGEAADPQVESVRRISNEFSPLAVHMHLDYWGNNFLDLFSEGSRKGSASNLQPSDSRASSQQQLFPENIYSRDTSLRDPRVQVALEVLMTSCSKCHNCSCVLYDEEIMAGWVPEDSNLNTKCQFCSKATVPFLSVMILDYRGQPMVAPSASQESVSTNKATRSSLSHLGVSNTSVNSASVPDAEASSTVAPKAENEDDAKDEPPVELEPIIVPYLNPLVLRKELESILQSEGDVCLTQPCFVDQHPIIYWNVVWVFHRTDVVSHLPGLCLRASTVNRAQAVHASWGACDQHNVAVRCLWDNTRLHDEVGLPMYVLWQQQQPHSDLVNALITDRTSVSRTVMQGVVSSVRGNDLQDPLRRLAVERHKLKGRGVHRSHSLYREILFLAFAAMGRKNIDQAAFDREYVCAYEKLSESDLKLYSVCDRPLSMAALCCRHYFRELEL